MTKAKTKTTLRKLPRSSDDPTWFWEADRFRIVALMPNGDLRTGKTAIDSYHDGLEEARERMEQLSGRKGAFVIIDRKSGRVE